MSETLLRVTLPVLLLAALLPSCSKQQAPVAETAASALTTPTPPDSPDSPAAVQVNTPADTTAPANASVQDGAVAASAGEVSVSLPD